MNDLAGPYAGLDRAPGPQPSPRGPAPTPGSFAPSSAIEHTVGVHERGGHDLEFLVTRQWFVKLLEHKERWLDAGRRIRWHPEHMRARYENWIEGLNWDWNISRQRYYGVPFPVWYCRACDAPIAASAEQLPVDPQESPPPSRACPRCGGSGLRARPGRDGHLGHLLRHAPRSAAPCSSPTGSPRRSSTARYRPMTLRPNAHDIIRTWDFYTIVRSLYLTGDVPWTDVLISGHALDPSGKKISKSKLSVAEDPTPMLEQFSADAVRYWAASVRTGGDTNLSEEVFRNGSKLVTKLWNASKFALSHLGGASLPPRGAAPAAAQRHRPLAAGPPARGHPARHRGDGGLRVRHRQGARRSASSGPTSATTTWSWSSSASTATPPTPRRPAGRGRRAPGRRRAGGRAAPDGWAPATSSPRPSPPCSSSWPPSCPTSPRPSTPRAWRQARPPSTSPPGRRPPPPGTIPPPRRRGGHPAGGRRRPALEGRAPAQRRRPPGRPAHQRPPEHLPALQSALLDLQGVTQAGQVQLEPAPAGAPISIEIADALPAT